MICGALQTLNEEAFEDVIGSERPSPTGLPGEMISQQLEPIRESAEFSSNVEDNSSYHGYLLRDENHFNNFDNPTVIIMPAYNQINTRIDDTRL